MQFEFLALPRDSAEVSIALPEPGYKSTGTQVAGVLRGFHSAPYQVRATSLGVAVQTMRWPTTIRQPAAQALKPASWAVVVVRTGRVWVDRPSIHVVFAAYDEDGASRLASMPEAQIKGGDVWPATACSPRSSGQRDIYTFGACVTSVSPSSFERLTGEAKLKVELVVDGVELTYVTPAEVTLTPPPNWFDATGVLRRPVAGLRSTHLPHLTEPGFLTLPTHPLNAGEAFEVLVFANTQVGNSRTLCSGGKVCETGAWGVTLFYDPKIIIYDEHVESSKHFGPADVTRNMDQVTSQLTVGVQVSDGEPANSAQRAGVFFLFSARFRVAPGVRAGVINTGLRMRVDEILSAATLAELTRFSAGRIMDHRDNHHQPHKSAIIEIVGVVTVGLFLASNDGSGQLFNEGKITGVPSERLIRGMVVSNKHSEAEPYFSSASLTSCKDSAAQLRALADPLDPFTASIQDASCQLALTRDALSGVVEFDASSNSLRGTYRFRIISPKRVTILPGDRNLNRLATSADANGNVDSLLSSSSCGNGEGAYQRTTLRVLADGLDVTSLLSRNGPPRLVSSDPAVAELITIQHGSYDRLFVVQGKSIGATTVSLFAGSNVTTTIFVVDEAVTPVSMSNTVVTGIEWIDAPPDVYTYPEENRAVISVTQVLTQRPYPGTPPHFGYVFATVEWSDGTSSDITPAQTQLEASTSNIAVASRRSLDEYWRVEVASDADAECVNLANPTVTASYVVCNERMITSFVALHVNVPMPKSVRGFSLVEPQLTPEGSAPTLAPFSLPSSSRFRLLVEFDDGSTVDMQGDESATYNLAPDVHEKCAALDGSARSIRILPNARCPVVKVLVTFVMGGFKTTLMATRPVAHIATLKTTFSVYPQVSADGAEVASLRPLPCSQPPRYERARVRTLAVLSGSGETADVTSQMLYQDRLDVLDFGVDGTVAIPTGNTGRTVIGSTSEMLPRVPEWQNDAERVHFEAAHLEVSAAPRVAVPMISGWFESGSTLAQIYGDAPARSPITLQYEDAGVTFRYDNLCGHEGEWFGCGDLLAFTSSKHEVIRAGMHGELMLLANHHRPVELSARLKCLDQVHITRVLWANLLPGENDVDLGTRMPESAGTDGSQAWVHTKSPFYMPSPGLATLHLWARPMRNEYLRSVEIELTLPTGMTSVGGSFAKANGAAQSMTVVPGFAQVSPQVAGLSAFYTGRVPQKDTIYVGTFRFRVAGSGDLGGWIKVELKGIESERSPAIGDTDQTTTGQRARSLAASGPVFVGEPTPELRRSLADARRPNRTTVDEGVANGLKQRARPTSGLAARRKLQNSACDPCRARVPGDANGDCAFTILDASTTIELAVRRNDFSATGKGGDDAYDSFTSCDFQRRQLNPSLNVFGVGPADPRFGKEEVTRADGILLARATQHLVRLISVEASCVDGKVANRPDARIRVQALAPEVVDTAARRRLEMDQTDVYLEIVAAQDAADDPWSGAGQPFRLDTGGEVTRRTFNGQNVPVGDVAYKDAGLQGHQHASVVVRMAYNREYGGWEARLQPSEWVGFSVSYYVAVAVETRDLNGNVCTECRMAYLGLSTFPYGPELGSSFNPIIGGARSTIQTTPLICQSHEPTPHPPPPPPPSPPPPSPFPPPPPAPPPEPPAAPPLVQAMITHPSFRLLLMALLTLIVSLCFLGCWVCRLPSRDCAPP